MLREGNRLFAGACLANLKFVLYRQCIAHFTCANDMLPQKSQGEFWCDSSLLFTEESLFFQRQPRLCFNLWVSQFSCQAPAGTAFGTCCWVAKVGQLELGFQLVIFAALLFQNQHVQTVKPHSPTNLELNCQISKALPSPGPSDNP